jgi:hypothetical protein
MAELVPNQYRLRIAHKACVAQWIIRGALVMGLCLAILAYTFLWQRRQSALHDSLIAQYEEKSALIHKADELCIRRLELASRMQQVQQLMDDKMLLTLLRNIADGFGTSDCLEYIHIDARTDPKSKSSGKATKSSYAVQIIGITSNSTTLADLMTRLSRRNASTTMNVVLESSNRDTDKQVMRFRLLCEQAPEKGS